MSWLKNYFWEILAALGVLTLAIFGLVKWWRRRKTLSATAADLAESHVRATERMAEAHTSEVARKERDELAGHQNEAVNEVDNGRISLADRLSGLGAGKSATGPK